MRVRAIAQGFNVAHRMRGEIFVISDAVDATGKVREFSEKWMEPAPLGQPLGPLPKVNPR